MAIARCLHDRRSCFSQARIAPRKEELAKKKRQSNLSFLYHTQPPVFEKIRDTDLYCTRFPPFVKSCDPIPAML